MTTATPTGMTHPTDGQLALFIDGRLDEQSRQMLVDHLAVCDECYGIVQTSADLEGAETRTAVRHGRWWAVAAAAAVAAGATVIIVPEFVIQRDMSRLYRAAERLEFRHIESRLDAEFAYRKLEDDASRGREGMAAVTLLGAEAADVIDAARRRPTTANLRRAGVAMLLINAHDDAIAYLERAARQSKRSDPEVLTTLAAAYQARAAKTHSTSDAALALLFAEQAWAIEKTPLTAWNRAVALEGMRSPSAAAAWRRYVEIDATSQWANEARRHLAGRVR